MPGNLSEAKVAETTLAHIFACLDLEDLWRHLVVRVEEELACKQIGPQSEVVLDLHVDGARYILMRSIVEAAPLEISLSPREKEIVRLVAKGLPNKVISDVLDISPWTVATYLRRIFAKLGVASRAEMVACALGTGLLEHHHPVSPTCTSPVSGYRLKDVSSSA